MQDSLGDRMKSYEDTYRLYLPKRQPLILRLDGVAHSTLTQSMNKPWDDRYIEAMNAATLELCARVQGTVLAYTQSDEISLLLVDYQKYETEPWFGKNLQKMVSVSAGIASMAFSSLPSGLKGFFDCRAIPLTREEVANYFLWRQRDCIRNSILGLGQVHLGKGTLHGQNCDEIIGRLIREKEINWNQCHRHEKYGRVATKIPDETRSHWVIGGAPLFEETRNIIDSLVWPEDEEGQYSHPRETT